MSLSVLVADDSKLSRRSVIRSLPQDLEYDITEATNGQEAINSLSESEFGLILLDLTMPEVDGVGVLEFLHARPNMPNVIVISADFQPEKPGSACRNATTEPGLVDGFTLRTP